MSKLILLRHGQSEWNKLNQFTGWKDVNLSQEGMIEAKLAAFAIQNLELDIHFGFTSNLIRAQKTLEIILKILKLENIKVEKNIALNERDYGKLTGLNKDEARKKWGEEQVKIWRRSYNVAPEDGESLKDTYERAVPYFETNIVPELKKEHNVIISAHGNSLRSIIMNLEELNEKEIIDVEIATGTPIVYELDNNCKIIKKNGITHQKILLKIICL